MSEANGGQLTPFQLVEQQHRYVQHTLDALRRERTNATSHHAKLIEDAFDAYVAARDRLHGTGIKGTRQCSAEGMTACNHGVPLDDRCFACEEAQRSCPQCDAAAARPSGDERNA